MIGRRGFLTGLGAVLITAPAIVRAGSLMPVKTMIEPYGVGPMMSAMEALQSLAAQPFPEDFMFDFDAIRSDMMRLIRVPPHILANR